MSLLIEKRRGSKGGRREDMAERFSPEVVARIVADQIQQALDRT
jgi:hypothetical protein